MKATLIHAAIIGTGGTLLMTGALYLAALLSKKRLEVVHILGTMLTNQTTVDRGLSHKVSALFTGGIVHFLVGIMFAYVYLLGGEEGIIQNTVVHSLYFGCTIGLFAVVVWGLFIRVHPNPPLLNFRIYLLSIFLSHLIFAAGTWCAYLAVPGQ